MKMNTIVSKAQRMDQCRRRYMAELARGGSHIASTLTPDGERSAISEVTGEFHRRYGTHDFEIFLELLAQALDARLRPETAAVVRSHRQTTHRQSGR